MYKINFNHLFHFLTIAKEGSIVKAAKKLNVSQPALSHQLKLLEQDLGEKLFDRKGKKLLLNSYGEKVKDYATKIFRQSEEMLQFVQSGAEHVIKIVKIGTVPWLSKDQTFHFLKPLLSSQHIKLEVYQKDLTTLLNDVKHGKLDLVLCDSPYSGQDKTLQEFRLSTDSIICVAANKNGIEGRFPKCLNNKKIISYAEASIMSDKIDDFINSNRIQVETVGAFTDSSLIRVAVEKSRFIGFLPESVAKESLKNKNLVKIGTLPTSKFSLWAITTKDIPRDSLIYNLIDRFRV